MPIEPTNWRGSAEYLEGIALFNAGYYWEAHEVWERLWHVHQRRGPIADLLKGLIKLAACGVKVRERRPPGAATHAGRAASLFERLRGEIGSTFLGLELDRLAITARSMSLNPPIDEHPRDLAVARVLPLVLEPA